MNPDTYAALTREFDETLVLERKGPYGKTLSYLPAHVIIERLNSATGGAWSFNVVRHEVQRDEVIVVARLTLHADPEVVKETFGSARIKRSDAGEALCIGDDLKSAGSDALKKCATLLGVGTQLYRDSPRNGGRMPDNGRNGNSNGRVTQSQLALMHRLVDQLEQGDWRSFRAWCQAHHGTTPEYLDKKRASSVIDGLMARVRGAKSNGTAAS